MANHRITWSSKLMKVPLVWRKLEARQQTTFKRKVVGKSGDAFIIRKPITVVVIVHLLCEGAEGTPFRTSDWIHSKMGIDSEEENRNRVTIPTLKSDRKLNFWIVRPRRIHQKSFSSKKYSFLIFLLEIFLGGFFSFFFFRYYTFGVGIVDVSQNVESKYPRWNKSMARELSINNSCV